MTALIVTNSSLTTFRACPRLYQLKYVDGYRPVDDSEELELGSAMHRALESWWTDGDYDKAKARLGLDGLQQGKADVLLAGYHHRWTDDRALYEVIGLEVPFSFRMPGMRGVKCAGKIDGIVRKVADDTVWLVEHKTTGSDLSPGSTYWQRLGMDSQISMYFDGAKSLGHDVAGCLYDVIGKPKLRGKNGETPEQLAARIGEAIIAAPDSYYQRSEIVRFGNELADARSDVVQTTRLLRTGRAPRNVDACYKYGAAKPCSFADVCAGNARTDDETKFRRLDDVHPELAQPEPRPKERVIMAVTAAAPVRAIRTQKGRIKAALRYIFYGDNGIGKSTLAAHAPAPVWFDVEDGSGRLDVDRFVFRDGPGGHVPLNYGDLTGAVEALTTTPHAFQTLVIDTTDRLESLMWNTMCERDRKSSIEDYGYGKGYTAALDEWRRLCSALDRLRSTRAVSVVLLAHAQIRTFKNPGGDDYDRYQLRVNDKAAGFLKEWADVVGFCAFEEGGAKLDKDDDRAKGYSTGKRFIHFERTAAYDAKTRIVLPSKIELDPRNPWEPLAQAVNDGVNLSADELRALVSAELARIADPDLSLKVLATVAKAGDDVEALSRFVNGLKKQPTKSA